MRGLHLRKPGNTLSHTNTMRTIEQTFQQLTALITDQTRDLALAMAELRSVAAERDKLKAERDNLSEALQRNCVQYVEKQQALIAERDNARQSLRAAEADAAETEGVNSDLRTVNARLVADLAAAVQRADTAGAILRAMPQPFYIQPSGTLIGTTTDAQ